MRTWRTLHLSLLTFAMLWAGCDSGSDAGPGEFSPVGTDTAGAAATDPGGVQAVDPGAKLDTAAPQVDPGRTSQPNRPPVIASTSIPSAAAAGEKIMLGAEASDEDGDPLTFRWESTCGDVPAADGQTAPWTAPAERGSCTLTVFASDGRGGEVSQSSDLKIVAWELVENASNMVSSLSSISFSPEGDGFAVGGSDTDNTPYILTYKNGVWANETPAAEAHLHAVKALSSNNVWAAGGGGAAYHYDGSAWTPFTIPGGCLHELYFVNPNLAWVGPAHAGQPTGMRKWTGGTFTAWSDMGLADHQGISDIHFSAENNGWAVGPRGRVYYNNGGDEWTRVGTPFGDLESFDAVFFLSPYEGWFAGARIVRFDGTTFSEVEPEGVDAPTWYHGVYFSDPSNGWLGGTGGTMLHYDGTAWEAVASPTDDEVASIVLTSPTEGWAVTHGGQVLHLY